MSIEKPQPNTYLNLVTTRSPDNTDVEVAIGRDAYDYINEMCINTEYMPLPEFAEIDTRRAYKICKAGLQAIFTQHVTSISLDRALLADSTNAQPHEMRNIITTLLESLPDEDVENIDLSIVTHASDEDINLLHLDPSTEYELLKIHVEPPSLAA